MPTPAEAGCSYCDAGTAGAEAEDGLSNGQPRPGWLAHLYECQGWSTYQIGERTGLGRQRVTRALRKAGVEVRPRGAGRDRGSTGDPGLPQLMRQLYEETHLSSRQIAALLSMPERTVRDKLRRYGIATRTRGGWNREDRRTIPPDVLTVLYSQLGMTADEIGERLGTSRTTVLRSAHAFGLPVRSGGAVPVDGPPEIELIGALYGDPLIDAVLTAHGVPRVPAGGPISTRFPKPVPLTTPLVKDLYWGCGTSVTHIELLTGQAAESIRRFMRRAGIPLRHSGGRSPFLRRWRTRGGEGLTMRTRHAPA
ncbi:MAG: hypothetical protein ACRDN0_40450 [Trebonia sp.]